ncbi:hypothetical protein J8655_10505 [Dickeya oryzae]|uniref:hypothetical protein n=1 Tax=Dickeya oryzae TaxID=1240404 RepID=UPI001AED123A|nr:hypothetical protein [Dickeya oryzae]MBP2845909.1 hypothetical protein [Dickeya oryzae]
MAIEVRQLTIYSRVIQPNDPDAARQDTGSLDSDTDNTADNRGQDASHSAPAGTQVLHHLNSGPRER